MARTDLLVWIDLEMTGLDPAKERIIEIATIITDGDLDVIAEGPDLVVKQPESLLEAMDEWNTTHHTESGLIEQVRNSDIDTAAAEQQTLDFIKEHCAERSAPLCGNSIWQDRRFLHRYMPSLAEYLHYRSIDVSSFKELVKRWKPEATAPRKQASHRALDDIRESIAELRHYREHLFG